MRTNLNLLKLIQAICKATQKGYSKDKIPTQAYIKWDQFVIAIKMTLPFRTSAFHTWTVQSNIQPNKQTFIIMQDWRQERDRISILPFNFTPKPLIAIPTILRLTSIEDLLMIELERLIKLSQTTQVPYKLILIMLTAIITEASVMIKKEFLKKLLKTLPKLYKLTEQRQISLATEVFLTKN